MVNIGRYQSRGIETSIFRDFWRFGDVFRVLVFISIQIKRCKLGSLITIYIRTYSDLQAYITNTEIKGIFGNILCF